MHAPADESAVGTSLISTKLSFSNLHFWTYGPECDIQTDRRTAPFYNTALQRGLCNTATGYLHSSIIHSCSAGLDSYSCNKLVNWPRWQKLWAKTTFSFFHSVLRWSVAVSTMRRQSSRIAAFLQADARPMFCWPRSASTARSQYVWLGLPDGRFQSGGSPRITAATARWWSSRGELRAVCPKSRKRLSVTRWERGEKRHYSD